MAVNTTSLIRRIVEKQASQTARDMRHWRQAKQEATKPDMPKRVRLVDLINDLLYDTHLSSQMELRIDTSLAKSFSLLREDDEPDEDTTALMRRCNAFGDLIRIALETPFCRDFTIA